MVCCRRRKTLRQELVAIGSQSDSTSNTQMMRMTMMMMMRRTFVTPTQPSGDSLGFGWGPGADICRTISKDFADLFP